MWGGCSLHNCTKLGSQTYAAGMPSLPASQTTGTCLLEFLCMCFYWICKCFKSYRILILFCNFQFRLRYMIVTKVYCQCPCSNDFIKGHIIYRRMANESNVRNFCMPITKINTEESRTAHKPFLSCLWLTLSQRAKLNVKLLSSVVILVLFSDHNSCKKN